MEKDTLLGPKGNICNVSLELSKHSLLFKAGHSQVEGWE